MKRTLSIFIFAVLLSTASLWADRAGFTIKNYTFQGVYHADNTISVKEIIDVDFSEPRHGLYRQIPSYFYLDVSLDENYKDVKRYSTEVYDFSAGSDPFTSDKEDGEFQFKVGSSYVEISGPKKYEFTYTYQIPDDRTTDADFIFYSMLGAEWETTIDHFSFSMAFDNGVPENYEIFSGEYGSRENPVEIACQVEGNTISGSADNLGPNTAVTLYAVVEEGYFSNEREMVPVLLVWFQFLIALGFGIFAVLKCMKSKVKTPVQTIEFYPPEGISSAEVGTIIDNSADTEDLVSLIPLFASKGYLKIREEKKYHKTVTILTKVKNLPGNAPEYQKTFFDGLFTENEISLDELPSSFASVISDAKKQLSDVFKGEKTLYKGKKRAFLIPLVLSVLTSFTFINDSPVEFLYNFTGSILPGVFMLMAFWINIKSFKRNFHKKSFTIRIIVYAVISFLAAGIYISDIFDGLTESILPWWCSMILLILDFIASVFAYRMIITTDWNVAVTGKLMGLKEFIKTAELPKLKMLMDQNPEYFYDILPYAMVFKLTDKWAKLFENLEVREPDWYHSVTPGVFSPQSLVYSIDSGVSHCISQSVASSSASSGGGGFSGGGGGGGGGGSW